MGKSKKAKVESSKKLKQAEALLRLEKFIKRAKARNAPTDKLQFIENIAEVLRTQQN